MRWTYRTKLTRVETLDDGVVRKTYTSRYWLLDLVHVAVIGFFLWQVLS